MKKRKKKKFIIAIVIVLVLLMIACGGRGSKDEPAESSTGSDAQTTENYDSGEADEADQEEATDPDADADDVGETADSDTGLLSPEFKKTMDDYEAWFDHYCDVMKKYQDNPSDLELMSEMTELLAEENEMLEQLDSMDESEMNNAELAYYIEVTARIEKKLLEVADY